jgi:hypothetical protein
VGYLKNNPQLIQIFVKICLTKGQIKNDMTEVKRIRAFDSTPLIINSEKSEKKTLHLYFEESDYSTLLADSRAFRAHLHLLMSAYSELFPADMLEKGYDMHDIRYSERQHLAYRRIRLRNASKTVLTILPSFIMPYWVRRTEEAASGLLLRYCGTSYDLISTTLGGSAVHWERMETHLGTYDIVATTLIGREDLPVHYVADEKITFFHGKEAFVALTAAQECVWGIAISLSEGQDGLQTAYGNFATEARLMKPDFAPKSVVIDGWAATRNAWSTLFTTVTLILCFLHGVLKVGSCTKNLKEQWAMIKKMLWEAYKATDTADFIAQIDAFKLKADELISPLSKPRILEAIEKIWAKKDQYAKYYEFSEGYRTSNHVDRPMNRLDKYLYSTQYFHGNLKNAELKLRAWALIHNFKPYCKKTASKKVWLSRAHEINKVIYHDNWLENLLIAGKKANFNIST